MRIKFVISMFLAALAATAQTRMSVDSCMRYAANHNLDVRAARISLSDSRLDQQSALASILPSVGAQIGAQFSFGRSIDPATNTYNNLRTFSNSYGLGGVGSRRTARQRLYRGTRRLHQSAILSGIV